MRLISTLLTLASASVSLWAQTNVLTLPSTRATGSISTEAEARVKQFGRNVSALTRASREARSRATGSSSVVFSMPVRVNVAGLATVRSPKTRGLDEITLAFDDSGPRAFPSGYRALLENTFANAKSTMNTVFGAPAFSGVVHVRNYDADLGDRDAVAGGFYLPNNGSGEREIRFPVYLSDESAAVNFIHTLLLAYQGDTVYAFDGFQEGLVRAATMRIARQSSAMIGLLPEKIEETLAASYDASTHYDWFNQPALGGPRFIAPNLRDAPLPTGGSLGGVFLLRYLMAGSAWQKVLAEYPTFIDRLNQQFYGQPALANDLDGLIAAGQTILNSVRPSDPTIEGLSFGDWFERQAILDPSPSVGLKLVVEPLPITSGLAGTDFGVFLIQSTYFSTNAAGDEFLLSGTSYPIFWDGTFNRVFPDAQSERMEIAGAYGSVAPNFPNQNAGRFYRIAVDIPVQDQISRTYVPAGAIAIAGQAAPNDFYGTVVGIPSVANTTLKVRITIGSEVVDNIAVSDNAFGTLIDTDNFLGMRSTVIELIRVSGTDETVLATRRVNKGAGPLAVTLDPGKYGAKTFGAGLPKGINFFGLPNTPSSLSLARTLGLPADDILVARYNPSRARYDLTPETEPLKAGNGYFLRLNQSRSAFSIRGTFASTDAAIALRPGWNMITTPLDETVPTSRIQVVRTVGFPRAWSEAAGEDIGLDIFAFQPGSNDLASGVPETGTFSSTTQFVPGQAYFVRCLAPEGVTLLFQSTGGPGRVGSVGRTPQWSVRVDAYGRDGLSQIHLGMDRIATISFDRQFDSGLPPGIGGFQLVAEGAQYRQVGPLRSTTSFPFRADGLRVGESYTIQLAAQVGYASRLTLISSDGTRTVLGPNRRFTWRARSKSSEFRLVVEGAR